MDGVLEEVCHTLENRPGRKSEIRTSQRLTNRAKNDGFRRNASPSTRFGLESGPKSSDFGFRGLEPKKVEGLESCRGLESASGGLERLRGKILL